MEIETKENSNTEATVPPAGKQKGRTQMQRKKILQLIHVKSQLEFFEKKDKYSETKLDDAKLTVVTKNEEETSQLNLTKLGNFN